MNLNVDVKSSLDNKYFSDAPYLDIYLILMMSPMFKGLVLLNKAYKQNAQVMKSKNEISKEHNLLLIHSKTYE